MRTFLPLCRPGWFLSKLQPRHHLRDKKVKLNSGKNQRLRDKKVKLSSGKRNVGLFCIPELKDSSGFKLLLEKVNRDIAGLINEAISPARSRNIVEILDELWSCYRQIDNVAKFVCAYHPKRTYKMAAHETIEELNSIYADDPLSCHSEIHKVLKHVLENDDITPMNSEERRVAELFMSEVEHRSHLVKDEEKRWKTLTLLNSITELSKGFLQGTKKLAHIPKDMIPEVLTEGLLVEGDNIIVGGLYMDRNHLMREITFRAYVYPDYRQEQFLSDLLGARMALAKLKGFPNYASEVLKESLAETPENVMNFLTTLAENIKDSAEKDIDDMRKHKVEATGEKDAVIMPWDYHYYVHLETKYEVLGLDYIPCWSQITCLKGLSQVFKGLFGVTLDPARIKDGDLWTRHVLKMNATHSTEGVLGYIYWDFFSDEWVEISIQSGRRKLDGSYQLPKAAVMCKRPLVSKTEGLLLDPFGVKALFHEFGHAIQDIMSRTQYQHVTGIHGTAADLIEVPSVLMEYFASDPRVLSSFKKTGLPIPEEEVDVFCRVMKLYQAAEIQHIIARAVMDQICHSEEIPYNKSTTEIMAEVHKKYISYPYVPNTALQLRNTQIVGYGGKFYCYLMARAVASKLWRKLFKDDPFSRENGEKYRQKWLAVAGAKSPKELFRDMFNEEPTVEVLVKSLADELRGQ